MPSKTIAGMPRGVVIFGGVGAAGVVGYLIYRHITKPTTTTPSTTPTTGGYGYGYGYGSTYGGYGYGYGSTYGSGFGGGGYWPGGGFGYGYGTSGGGNPPPITTNAQWGQAAESAMGSSGNDAIAAAIAKYLSGQAVTQQQELVIQEAEAVVGPPPQEAASGYPPKIHVSKGGGGGGSGATNPVTGLRVTNAGTTGVDISWNAAQGATSYQVTSTHGNAGMTGPTSARIHSVNAPGKGGTTATVQVLAEPAATGAQPASLQIKTRG